MHTLNREPQLDILRGFAIFGIFFVNITIMHCLFINQDAFLAQFQDPISGFINRLLQLFFYNKFFPIFSFLFGFGIASQLIKKQQLGTPFSGFLLRRMTALFVFGWLHIVFLWPGDVLHLYAVLGLMSLVLLKLKNKQLVILAVLLLIFPFYDAISAYLLGKLSTPLDAYLVSYGSQGIISVMQSGTLVEVIQLRVAEYLANLPMLLFYLAPMALSLFMLGIVAGRATLKFASIEWVNTFKNPVLFLFVITSFYRIAFLFWLPDSALYRHDLLRPLWFKLMFLSDITLGLCYLWGIAWLWHNQVVTKALMLFSYVGRLALTNYLLQSLMGVILFTNVGLSLYQTLSPLMCFIIAFACFCVQAVLSRIWLTHFKYGPLEWVWRCITYKQKMPIKRSL